MQNTELSLEQTFKDDGETMTISEIFDRNNHLNNIVYAKDMYGCNWQYTEGEILEALKLPSQDVMDV